MSFEDSTTIRMTHFTIPVAVNTTEISNIVGNIATKIALDVLKKI